MFILFLIALASAANRKIGQKGLDLIKEFEGCRLTAYKCPAGVWTIGYGTTSADSSITGTKIYEGMTISKATAEEWLRKSVDAKYAGKVNKYMSTYNWNQCEFDALVSFAYNIGSIDQLTASGTRSRSTIASKMLEYVNAGGKRLEGLVRRRKAERELFLSSSCPASSGSNDSGNNNNNGGGSSSSSSGSVKVTASALNVRASSSTSSSSVAKYYKGETINYDKIVKNSECTWLSYVGGSGKRRYVCGKTPSGTCYVSPCP